MTKGVAEELVELVGLANPHSWETGTAQNPHGNDHSWFAAFPVESPRYVFVVLVENGGEEVEKQLIEVRI
jgi:hypothetical protein